MPAQAYPLGARPNPISDPISQPASGGMPMTGRPGGGMPAGGGAPMQGGMREAGRDPSQLISQLSPEQQSIFQNMPPEQQTQFLTLLSQDFGAKGAAAESDMSRADAIRREAGPQGRYAGGMYQAANPLEHLAKGMQNYKAGNDFRGSREARDASISDADALRKRAMEQMVSRSQALRQ